MVMAEDTTAREEKIGRILNELLDLQAQGRPVSRGQILAEHPDLAEELEDHLGMLERLAPAPQPCIHEEMLAGFQVLEELGRGGMGVVYKAYQLSTRQVRAVKVMLDGPFAGESGKRRFELEVELAAGLSHPNIVGIHDSGLDKGHYYLVMDYLEGVPFDQYARHASLSTADKMRLMLKICRAVQYAHQKGVIHRDLKPANILIDEAGEPHLLDFGLARHNDPQDRSRVSRTGQVLGTLPYMSPEQAEGDPRAVDTRTDIYSLGVMMYELMTAAAPYETASVSMAQALENIRLKDPVRPSKLATTLNSEIDAIILRALAKEPARRYASAGDLADDIAAWLDGRPVTVKSDSAFYVLRKLAARHYFHTSVIVALLAAIAGFGGITWQALRHAREANNDLRQANQHYAATNHDLNKSLDITQARINQHALTLLVMAWRDGHVESARKILAERIPSSAPEYLAATYLLNHDMTPDQLRRRLAGDTDATALFVIGERYLREGRRDKAREAFAQYAEASRGVWLDLVRARLAELEEDSAEVDVDEKASLDSDPASSSRRVRRDRE